MDSMTELEFYELEWSIKYYDLTELRIIFETDGNIELECDFIISKNPTENYRVILFSSPTLKNCVITDNLSNALDQQDVENILDDVVAIIDEHKHWKQRIINSYIDIIESDF